MIDALVALAGAFAACAGPGLVFRRRRNVRKLRWPATASHLKFIGLCRTYLTFTGWKIMDGSAHPHDLKGTKDGLEIYFLCRPTGMTAGPDVLAQTAAYYETFGRKSVVIQAEALTNGQRSIARDLGLDIIHYMELDGLPKILSRRSSNKAHS